MAKTIAGIRQGPGNRSHPHPGAPDAPPINVQGEGVGHPKRTQRDLVPHPSMTVAQRQPGGRAHPVPGLDPAAPINACNHTGKDTPTPETTFGAHGPTYLRPGEDAGCTRHAPELGDAVLDEAHMSNRLPGERHHSVTGKKG